MYVEEKNEEIIGGVTETIELGLRQIRLIHIQPISIAIGNLVRVEVFSVLKFVPLFFWVLKR